MRSIFFTVVFYFFLIHSGNSKVVVHSPASYVVKGNDYIQLSTQYEIEVLQHGVVYNVPVYMMKAQWKTNNCISTSWAQFDFEGDVEVRVKRLNEDADFCNILPRNSINRIDLERNTATFVLKKQGQYSVEFEKGIKIKHPLLLFADPIESNIPDKNDDQVIWFDPGVHEIGPNYRISSGQTVYLQAGSYVKGQIIAEGANDIKILGRGIISGEDFSARSGNHMLTFYDCNNIIVKGITMIHAPRFNISLTGNNHQIENVKMMGWWFSTDGVKTGDNGIVRNCFFKVNDDAIKLYNNNLLVEDCVIWQMENGMPFQLGWNVGHDISNFHVRNCDIIRVEHEWDNENLACFGAIHGSRAKMSQYLFENITIDNAKWRLFHIVTRPNRWGRWNPKRGSISNLTFKNIVMHGKQKIPSLIKGHDKKHPVYNINFENLIINDKVITYPDPDNFIIDAETTYEIEFKE